MEILKAARARAVSERRQDNFTGTVWADTLISRPGEFLYGCILFTPASRTFWHRHERGQILNVTSGAGLICSAGGPVREICTGDVVWIPPGEIHWHGATPDSFMVHVVTSFGKTDWLEAVKDSDYELNSI